MFFMLALDFEAFFMVSLQEGVLEERSKGMLCLPFRGGY
jgi:hypothetical protein